MNAEELQLRKPHVSLRLLNGLQAPLLNPEEGEQKAKVYLKVHLWLLVGFLSGCSLHHHYRCFRVEGHARTGMGCSLGLNRESNLL
jgi:hypothetical protein